MIRCFTLFWQDANLRGLNLHPHPQFLFAVDWKSLLTDFQLHQQISVEKCV